MQTKKPKSKTLFFLCLTLIGITLLLSSCSGEDKKLTTYIRDLKITTNKKLSHTPVKPIDLRIPSPTNYISPKKRSPFSPEVNDLNKSASPLLIYPISMLKFVGTVVENGKVLAYLVAPDSKLYHIREGDKIGIHNGIVKTITPDQIVILEQNSEIQDKGATQIVTLRLRDET